MIYAVAIDDEPLALGIIENYCSRIDAVTLIGAFTSVEKAKLFIDSHEVNLIFLDIEMPSQNGMSFYTDFLNNIPVIFTTAYSEYAVEAFEINAIDYLLKPFSFERFLTGVNKVVDNNLSFIDIKVDYQRKKIFLEDILFVESYGDYLKFHIKNAKTIMTKETLKNMEEILPSNNFIRVHRSYIIAKNKIDSYSKREIIIEDFTIPIGKKFKELISERLFID